MLNSFFPEFYTYCKALNLAPNSIKNLKRYLSQLNDFLNARNLVSVEQITYAHLSDFAAFNDAAPSTVKARIRALKKFCAFLHLHDYIAVNNANGLSAPKMPKKETGFLNEDELKIIFSYLIKNINKNNGWRNFLILTLMAVMGLRKSSVSALDAADFDAANNRLFIWEKGNKDKRILYIPPALSRFLREYMLRCHIRSGPLFFNNRNKRLRPDGVNKITNMIKKELLEEGHEFAENIHPHIFRHSAATQIGNVAGFAVIKEMLGHRKSQNTRKYIHLSPVSYGVYMKRHPYFNQKEL